MSGLLDFLTTDEGRLGLGLLAAAGPRADGMGAGGRIQEAFAGQDARKKAQAEAEWKQMQMEEARAMMTQRQQAAAREQQMQDAYNRAQTPGQPALPPLMGDPTAGILQSQGRAAVPAGFNAQQFANEAGGIDWKRGLELQQSLQKENTINKLDVKDFTPQSVAKYAQSRNYGDLVRMDKLHFGDTGGAIKGFDSYTGREVSSNDKTQSPDNFASMTEQARSRNQTNALGWANYGLSKERFARESDSLMADAGGPSQAGLNKQFGKPQAGYRWKSDGSMEFIPGGPADQKAQMKTSGEGTVDSVVAGLRDKYEQLNKGGGIVNDNDGMFGNMGARIASTGLGQTVGGAVGTKNQTSRDDILMSRPLLLQSIMKATGMSAKQMDSNAELKLYLATATDPTKGLQANMNALERIEKLYGSGSGAKPNSGASGGWDAPKSAAMSKLPVANSSNRGRRIRDTETGKTLVSNGMTWTAE